MPTIEQQIANKLGCSLPSLGLTPQRAKPPQNTTLGRRVLIAVPTCHPYRAKVEAIRATWGRDAQGADLRFFFGGSKAAQACDEVILDCFDGYLWRKQKIIAMLEWALDHGYDYVWRVDDDVYVRPERLLAIERFDHCGFVAPELFNYPGWVTLRRTWPVYKETTSVRATLGPCIGLSRRSMEVIVANNLYPHIAEEDLWCSMQLNADGVEPFALNDWLNFTHWKGQPHKHDYTWLGLTIQTTHGQICSPNNTIAASWEYTPDQMKQIHTQFLR